MEKSKKIEDAVQALVDHMAEWGGVESYYESATLAQAELLYLLKSGTSCEMGAIVNMVQDYVMLLGKLKDLEKEVRNGKE